MLCYNQTNKLCNSVLLPLSDFSDEETKNTRKILTKPNQNRTNSYLFFIRYTTIPRTYIYTDKINNYNGMRVYAISQAYNRCEQKTAIKNWLQTWLAHNIHMRSSVARGERCECIKDQSISVVRVTPRSRVHLVHLYHDLSLSRTRIYTRWK